MGRKSLSVAAAVEDYLIALKFEGKAETTRDYYAYVLRRLAAHLKVRKVARVKTADLRRYLADLVESNGICPASTTIYSMIVKRFFGWLHEQGEIKANPLTGMKIHKIPWSPVPPFSDDEIQRLLGAAHGAMQRAILVLLLDTGLRASELAQLRLDNIDFALGEINIKGKRGKVRKVALNDAPKQALLAYLEGRAELNGRLWPEGFNRKVLANILDGIGARARVARVFPHRFRHTFSSRFLWATGDALALKELLGHESLVMVERYVAAMEGKRALAVHRGHSVIDL